MLRILFAKSGNGVWISHLDLMRVFQRAFRRAGFQIRHTNGFNPHAFVSIALPLSVGTSSQCEILEFDLEQPDIPLETLPERLNAVLPAGIRCLEAYQGQRKLKELVCLRTETVLEYDNGIPDGLSTGLTALFERKTLIVEKKTKSGWSNIDIAPMFHRLKVQIVDENRVVLDAVVQAQNPPLNPDLLVKAIQTHLPKYAPNFFKSKRLELYDANFIVFR